jgi:SH3-like domain-containing protein
VKVRSLIAGVLLALSLPATALEYRSTGRATLLYDAPAATARKVGIVGAGLPLEVVVESAAWVKVRDHTGRLAWIENAALVKARQVMIRSETSTVRQQPRGDGDSVFQVSRGVLLEVTGEMDAYGWLPVEHADGLQGWLPAHEAWGR